jgi:hypothetical protein
MTSVDSGPVRPTTWSRTTGSPMWPCWSGAGWSKFNGIDAEWLAPDEVNKVCPIVNASQDIRYPVLGSAYQSRAGIAKHDYVAPTTSS